MSVDASGASRVQSASSPARPACPFMEHVQRNDVFALVAKLLRQDLKLGAVAVDEQTLLVGGDLQLDSLDLLMLVTGAEKAYGIKLPKEKLGRSSMETVGRFTDLVHGQVNEVRGGGS